MTTDNKYCNDLYSYSRFKTKVIHIGDVPMGGYYPIRVQSMTNTNTLDMTATVEQAIRMIEAGCEYVRIATPGLKEAENLARIKKELHSRGYNNPMIADIQFSPAVAEYAARVVEKIRINPGNYIDRKNSGKTEYSEEEYREELHRISKRIAPLLNICKEYGTAIRIGTNHGSLSDRIVSRYGNTPVGMVESALEFIRMCEDQSFDKLVLSMKSSNIIVMIEAYRLLVHRMMKEDMNYPLHVGVTEAGSGEEGRIKSAAGIGALLEDGIGDTIRVSLSEAPQDEIYAAKTIANRYANTIYPSHISDIGISPVNPFEFHKHHSREVLNIGSDNVPVVIVTSGKQEESKEADYVYTEGEYLKNKVKIIEASVWEKSDEQCYPLFTVAKYNCSKKKSMLLNFIQVSPHELTTNFVRKINNDPTVVLVLESDDVHTAMELRSMFFNLINAHCKCPVIIHRKYADISSDKFQIYAASDIGLLLTDGLGDGIWLEAEGIKPSTIEKTSFDILQATGARIIKTEYISCPTCGRTSFDLMETLERIKQYTGHLKGLKIAIMGCVVNGPGEMANADYGYVGSVQGKINLYKGKNLVRRNVNEKDALDALMKLLKENGDWVEETDKNIHL